MWVEVQGAACDLEHLRVASRDSCDSWRKGSAASPVSSAGQCRQSLTPAYDRMYPASNHVHPACSHV